MNPVYIIYAICVLWAVETVILALVFMRTPVWTFLKCSIWGDSLLIEKLRGGAFFRFKSARKEGSTAVKSKGKPDGVYFTTPGSMMICEKGKIPTYFVASKSSFTTNFDFQLVINEVEKLYGMPIKDYAELSNAVKSLREANPESSIKLPAYNSIKLRDLDYYFPKYINIEDVDAKINFLAKKYSLLDKFLNGKNVMLLVIILIGGAIAYTIITKNKPPVVNLFIENGTRLVEAAVPGGGSTTTGILGFVNNTLIPG